MSMDSEQPDGIIAPDPNAANEPPRWLDQPGSVTRIIQMLCGVSALTVLADLFYVKHGHWHFQDFMGFDAAYGFVACVGLVIAAKGLRVLLMRDEDYYD